MNPDTENTIQVNHVQQNLNYLARPANKTINFERLQMVLKAEGQEATTPINHPPRERVIIRPFLHILAGAGAGAVSSVITCPLDVIKTRMQFQVANQPNSYNGIRDGLSKIYHSEGMKGYFRGLEPNLIALLPTWAVYFTAYETSKRIATLHYGLSQQSARVHLFSAVTAGAASVFATSPIWLIKTRLVTQSAGVTEYYYRNSLDAFRTIIRTEGTFGLYKGLGASLIGTVHVGIQFPLYEKLKHMFKPRGDPRAEVSTMGIMAASAISKVVASVAWYPHEVIRTRMQTEFSGRTTSGNVYTCFKHVLRTGGAKAFYRGIGTNLCRVVPACVLTFLTYEKLLRILVRWDTEGLPHRRKRTMMP